MPSTRKTTSILQRSQSGACPAGLLHWLHFYVRLPAPHSAFRHGCDTSTAQSYSCKCRLLKVSPEGSVPVVKDRETEEWFVDSAKFVDYLEDKHPQPALGKSTDAPDA